MQKNIWQRTEQFLGGLKFAVILLCLFSLIMIVGTFCESYYGTDFAGRLIYKSLPYMILQGLLCLCIFMAALLRLPPKKRLYGFYTIHSGLITICAGSFVTWYAGIDGNITLTPGTPTRTLQLAEDQFSATFPSLNKKITYDLPLTAFSTPLDKSYDDVKLLRYLPFANMEEQWNLPFNEKGPSSSKYVLSNDFVSQELTLTLHPEAKDFTSSQTLGKLQVHYLPAALADCFGESNPSGLILWNQRKLSCTTPEQQHLAIKKTASGKRFFVLSDQNAEGKKILLSFFPDFSPWPLDEKLQPVQQGNIRVFSKKIFEENPNLFLFGKKAAYFNGEQWSLADLSKGHAELPWMNFNLKLLRHEETLIPELVPVAALPIQKNNELIKGSTRSVLVDYKGRSYWVSDGRPLAIGQGEEKVVLRLGKKELFLPFEMTLTRFKMDVDPGTRNPASYESFVRVQDSQGAKEQHIFMNNPLKMGGFTFYQASYFQAQAQGEYGSVLSANVDPGRPWKYFGCLLLIFGAIWHYRLNKERLIRKVGETRS